MVRILIADDCPAVRRGLRTLLGLNSDSQVCGEASDGADAIENAQQLAPDPIVMDLFYAGDGRHSRPPRDLQIWHKHPDLALLRGISHLRS